MSSLEYLEEERQKLWKKTLELEGAINKKSSDYEKDAKQASKKASEYRNRSNEANEIVQKCATQTQSNLDKSTELLNTFKEYNDSIEKLHKQSKKSNININSYVESITSRKEALEKTDTIT